MPIRPSERAKYPKDWAAISKRIRERAEQRCECTGQCGAPHEPRCNAPNGVGIARHMTKPWLYITAEDANAGYSCESDDYYQPLAIKCVLTVAHLDHDPANCADGNLLALCQRCHVRYDAAEHAKNARATRRARKADRELF